MRLLRTPKPIYFFSVSYKLENVLSELAVALHFLAAEEPRPQATQIEGILSIS